MHPPRAPRGGPFQQVTCSFPGLKQQPGPALLQLALIASLFTTALGKCDFPPSLPFASLLTQPNQTEFESGTFLKYTCRPGYSRSGSNQFMICQDSGTWKNLVSCVKKRCSHPGEIRNGQVIIQTDLYFGSQISFTCSEGYLLVGSDTSYCDVEGRGVEWSNPLPECIVAKCGPPPDISNGRHSGRNKEFYTYGSSVTYSCNFPFSLIGTASISCSVDNKTQSIWTPSPPACKKISCPYPEVEHGELITGFRNSFRYKDSLEIGCEDGFKLVGNGVIRCEDDGNWSPPPPVCEINSCVGLPALLHANWTHSSYYPRQRKFYPIGSKMKFNCHPGYRASGPTTVTCQEDLTWSSLLPCEEVCCPIPVLKNGRVVSYRRRSSAQTCTYFYGDSITYMCREKDQFQSSCQSDGSWSPEPNCENSCIYPPNIAHGSYDKVKSFFGEEVKYTCHPGYTLVGTSTLSCNRGRWSAQAPQCKALCQRPEVKHGKLSRIQSQYQEQDRITVQCNTGYQLVGNHSIITCSEDRTWSPEVPRCEWEFPAGCESVAEGWKIMQCLPNPEEVKLAQEVYKLSLEIQLLKLQIEQAKAALQSSEL